MSSIRSRALANVTSYSVYIAEAAKHMPQRGSIHSVFNAAVNIVFPGIPQGTRKGYPYHTTPIPGGFVLSLNAASTPRMPNGVQLSSPPGSFPFSALRVGMPVIFGAQRLHIEAIDCSLDLSQSSQWNPHIQRPNQVDTATLQKNCTRLKTIAEEWFHAQGHEGFGMDLVISRGGSGDVGGGGACTALGWRGARETNVPFPYHSPQSACTALGWQGARADDRARLPAPGRCKHPLPTSTTAPAPTESNAAPTDILPLARHLCGRGIGLTPTGDDILAGWMAAGWLLHGPQAGFVETCRRIVEIARQQTHLLSQCWLAHAAHGNVAEPIAALLYAMTCADDFQLENAIKAVLAMGATSGYDLIQGILLACRMGYNE